MNDNDFEKLAGALDRLPNGFPRTSTNVEVRLLQKIFSPEEAHIACRLTGSMEAVEDIAERLDFNPRETRSALMQMVKKGMAWFERKDGKARFRLAPFIVGIFEDHVSRMDHEFAHLYEQYLLDGGAAGIMKMQPSLTRVVPATDSVDHEWILPYEDVEAILKSAKSFRLNECVCRKQQDFIGRKCDFALDNCLSFSTVPKPASPDDITLERALEILAESEEAGLVHTVSNIKEGMGFICNCCGCCCGILRTINELGIENSVAYANYYAVINENICAECADCVDRCQVFAIKKLNGIPEIDQDRCIGCGLCVTGCSTGAAKLVRKPDDQIVIPPADYAAWEKARNSSRGI